MVGCFVSSWKPFSPSSPFIVVVTGSGQSISVNVFYDSEHPASRGICMFSQCGWLSLSPDLLVDSSGDLGGWLGLPGASFCMEHGTGIQHSSSSFGSLSHTLLFSLAGQSPPGYLGFQFGLHNLHVLEYKQCCEEALQLSNPGG